MGHHDVGCRPAGEQRTCAFNTLNNLYFRVRSKQTSLTGGCIDRCRLLKMNIELDKFCPCCNFDTFKSEERLSYVICPICFWEDDPIAFEDPKFEGGANGVSLIQARRNFKEFGACEKDMIKNTRKPSQSDVEKFSNNNERAPLH